MSQSAKDWYSKCVKDYNNFIENTKEDQKELETIIPTTLELPLRECNKEAL